MKISASKIIKIFILSFSLTSCEAFLSFNGNVYDSANQPVRNAKITLLINKRTVEKIGSETDSVSMEKRNGLRKSGIKDELKLTIDGTYVNYKTLYTNEKGYFKSQTILIGCGFGCPKIRLVVEKDGRKKVISMDKQISRDSMKIILEKE
jgi:hypothetical protein